MTTMKATAIRITPEAREFFKKLHFHEIPEEANYIAFLEDGDASFLEDIEFDKRVFPISKYMVLSYHENVIVEL